jgi:hypothetical protein
MVNDYYDNKGSGTKMFHPSSNPVTRVLGCFTTIDLKEDRIDEDRNVEPRVAGAFGGSDYPERRVQVGSPLERQG